MKALKIIFIAVAIILVVYVALCAFSPKTFNVQRSELIYAPVALVFEEVNDFNNMQHWSPWKDYDADMQINISGKTGEQGYKYAWKSNNEKVGHGSLTRKSTVENKSVSNELFFEDFKMRSYVDWQLGETPEGTKVTWINSGEMPFLMRPMRGKMETMMAPDLEKGLQRLKIYCEAKPKPDDIKIEMTTVQPMNYLSLRDTATMHNISMKLGMAYGAIQQAIAKQKLQMTGAPFAIYYNEPKDSVLYVEPALPVNARGKDDGKVKAGMMKAGNAVVAHYFGAYHELSKAHVSIQTWLNQNNKTPIGAPWEVYITDPMTEKDTAKWQTDVYYPVQQEIKP